MTPTEAERLRALAAQGLTSRQIAEQLGMTRRAVICYSQRLGVELQHKPGTLEEAQRRAEQIRPLAAEGLTALQIGERVGMSRNAVTGLCSRQGIALKGRRGQFRSGNTEGRLRKSKFDATQPEATQSRRVSGVPLRERGCRWPAWGMEPPTHRYCGEPQEPGKPYCAGHCAAAYRSNEAA